MTFRERIADWISGGTLTLMYSETKRAMRKSLDCDQKFRDENYRRVLADYKLRRIAAEEKPTSNATVKRMARIARGEE